MWFLACRLPEEEFAVKKKANPAIPRLVLPPGYSISQVALSRFGTWRVARVARVTHLEVSCPKIAKFSLAPDHGGPIWLKPTEAQPGAFLEVQMSPSWAQPCPPAPTNPTGKL